MHWRHRAVFSVSVLSSLKITINASDFIILYVCVCFWVHESTTGDHPQSVEISKTEYS